MGFPLKLYAGFSLVETVLVLVVFSVLLTFGVPSLWRSSSHESLKVNANDFFAALKFARYLAVSRSERVGLCPSSKGGICSNRLGAWGVGWLVFAAKDRTGACTRQGSVKCVPGHGRIFRRHGAADFDIRIRANRNVQRRVFFGPQGMSPGYNGRFFFCGSSGGREIILSSTGRPRWGPGHRSSFCPSF